MFQTGPYGRTAAWLLPHEADRGPRRRLSRAVPSAAAPSAPRRAPPRRPPAGRQAPAGSGCARPRRRLPRVTAAVSRRGSGPGAGPLARSGRARLSHAAVRAPPAAAAHLCLLRATRGPGAGHLPPARRRVREAAGAARPLAPASSLPSRASSGLHCRGPAEPRGSSASGRRVPGLSYSPGRGHKRPRRRTRVEPTRRQELRRRKQLA